MLHQATEIVKNTCIEFLFLNLVFEDLEFINQNDYFSSLKHRLDVI